MVVSASDSGDLTLCFLVPCDLTCHVCTQHSWCLQVGPRSILAAGAYLEEGATVPTGEVWAGNPAKKLRDVKPKELEYLKSLPVRYTELAAQHNEVLTMLKVKCMFLWVPNGMGFGGWCVSNSTSCRTHDSYNVCSQ